MWMLLGCLFVALLILIGWNQPFKEHAERLAPGMFSSSSTAAAGKPAEEPATRATATTPAAARQPMPTPVKPSAATPAKRKDSWMWEEKKMDRPQPAGKGESSRR